MDTNILVALGQQFEVEPRQLGLLLTALGKMGIVMVVNQLFFNGAVVSPFTVSH